MVCVGRPLLLWLDLEKSITEGYASTNFFKILTLLICLIFGGMICYGRLFLGVHSLDQVIYGLLLGLWFTFTWHYCVSDYLLTYTDNLLKKKTYF